MGRFLIILILWWISSFDTASAIVCREHQVAGYSAALERGNSFLPPNTTDISQLAVYIERDPHGKFYFQSNFITDGFENPTKIGGGESITDVDQALLNIVYTSLPSRSEQIALHRMMLEKVRFFVSKDVFDADGTTTLNFKGSIKVTLVDPGQKTSSGGLIITADHPPPFGAERIQGCCVNGRPVGESARALVDLLHKSEINKSKATFISLVNDSATNAAIGESSLAHIAVKRTNVALSIDDMEAIFASNRGKDVIVLGHVENGNFVTRDSTGSIISSVPIDALRTLAVKYDNLLIELGCNTAGSASHGRAPGVSIATRFNTVDATNRLAKALDDSDSLSEFFQSLASDNLQVVLDYSAIESRSQYHAEYYDVSGNSATKVGDVTLTTRSGGIFRSIVRWFRS